MNSYAVLGPGGVGGLLAALLTRAGAELQVVAREPTRQLLQAEGIQLKSQLFGDGVVKVEAVTALKKPVDCLIVATKATALVDALERIELAPRMVLPLLNGFEHIELLKQRFGDSVTTASIRVESDRPDPGLIVHKSPAVRVELYPNESVRGPLDQLVKDLQRVGVVVSLGDSPQQIIWSKLMRLAPLALTTSATDRPIGWIREDPHWHRLLVDCVNELAAVAQAEGAQIQPQQALKELLQADPQLGSSMQRDIAAGRVTELDAVAGAALRAAARHGLRCPRVESVVELVKLRINRQ